MIPHIEEIKKLVAEAQNVLIVQADNPDGDSLGSALALEHILGDMGKTPHLYCGVDIPEYLRFLEGWDRVEKELPNKIDLTIIVDTSAHVLLEQLEHEPGLVWIAAKPVIVLDHHSNVECDIPYATVVCNGQEHVATGELIFDIAQELAWPLSVPAQANLMQSILSDTLGLSSEATTAATYRRIANMVDAGVDRAKLEEARRALSKMAQSVYSYKADLIKRTEFYGENGEVAVVTIPEEELFSIGTLYNPAPLILNEISMVQNVRVGIVLKRYKNRVTGAIRCTDGAGIAHTVAEKYGGGGHPYAAGFKVEKTFINFAELKSQVIADTLELLQ